MYIYIKYIIYIYIYLYIYIYISIYIYIYSQSVSLRNKILNIEFHYIVLNSSLMCRVEIKKKISFREKN